MMSKRGPMEAIDTTHSKQEIELASQNCPAGTGESSFSSSNLNVGTHVIMHAPCSSSKLSREEEPICVAPASSKQTCGKGIGVKSPREVNDCEASAQRTHGDGTLSQSQHGYAGHASAASGSSSELQDEPMGRTSQQAPCVSSKVSSRCRQTHEKALGDVSSGRVNGCEATAKRSCGDGTLSLSQNNCGKHASAESNCELQDGVAVTKTLVRKSQASTKRKRSARRSRRRRNRVAELAADSSSSSASSLEPKKSGETASDSQMHSTDFVVSSNRKRKRSLVADLPKRFPKVRVFVHLPHFLDGKHSSALTEKFG